MANNELHRHKIRAEFQQGHRVVQLRKAQEYIAYSKRGKNYSITNSPDIRACSCEYHGKPF